MFRLGGFGWDMIKAVGADISIWNVCSQSVVKG